MMANLVSEAAKSLLLAGWLGRQTFVGLVRSTAAARFLAALPRQRFSRQLLLRNM